MKVAIRTIDREVGPWRGDTVEDDHPAVVADGTAFEDVPSAVVVAVGALDPEDEDPDDDDEPAGDESDPDEEGDG